jgi:uncharacterized membrane protein
MVMHSSATDSAVVDPPGTDRTRWLPAGDTLCYIGAVLLGSVLIVAAAIRQPFSYDELQQIAPYGSSDLGTITGATRQPPIDPLLGALFHHLFGEGQLQDRLVPALSGIAALVLMSLLLRRFGLRYAGAFAVLVMATAPLMIRYSAYTRPYALPILLMILATYAITSWLQTGHRRWLLVAAVASVLLPLVRVPEPTAFLVVTVATMWWYERRGRLTVRQYLPVALIAAAAVLTVGLTQYFSLAESANQYFDPGLGGVIDRFPDGVHEVLTWFFPLMADSFPWWPVTVLVLVTVAALPAARRTLAGWPMFWPLLAAPVGFAVAYHFLNALSFEALPYRARAASFFLLPFVLVVAALAAVVERVDTDRRVRIGAGVLLLAAFATQLPATADVVRKDAAPDFGVISGVITSQVPDDAIVLYDRPTPVGTSRQPFLGNWRYMGDTPYVKTAVYLPSQLDEMPTDGPVYLVFNGQCAYHGRCVPGSPTAVDVPIEGWKIIYQHERFTLYAPEHGQSGITGVIEAMHATRQGLGLELGYLQTYVEAAALASEGRTDKGKALLRQMFDQAQATDPDWPDLLRHEDREYNLDPYDLDPEDVPND